MQQSHCGNFFILCKFLNLAFCLHLFNWLHIEEYLIVFSCTACVWCSYSEISLRTWLCQLFWHLLESIRLCVCCFWHCILYWGNNRAIMKFICLDCWLKGFLRGEVISIWKGLYLLQVGLLKPGISLRRSCIH